MYQGILVSVDTSWVVVLVSLLGIMCLLGGCVFKKNAGFRKATFHSRSDIQFGRHAAQNYPRGVLCAEQLKYISKDKGSASSSWVIEPSQGSKKRHIPSTLIQLPIEVSTKIGSSRAVSVSTPSGVIPTISDADKRKVSIKDLDGIVTYSRDEGFRDIEEDPTYPVPSPEVYRNPSSKEEEDEAGVERKVSPADSGMYSDTKSIEDHVTTADHVATADHVTTEHVVLPRTTGDEEPD